MKICFVCTGNTCRSPMAAALLKNILAKNINLNTDEIEIISAGIQAWPGDPASVNAVEVMRNVYDIDLSLHTAVRLTPEIIESTDILITMTNDQKELLSKYFPNFENRIKSLGEAAGFPEEDIIDPYGGSYEYYEKTAQQIYELLKALAADIKDFEGKT